jgi:uncharacterized protein YecE (DUF72 family)
VSPSQIHVGTSGWTYDDWSGVFYPEEVKGAVSHPRLPDTVLPTTDFLYLRFHGLARQLYNYDYSDKELTEWAARLRPHLAGRTLYAFFNNDYRANAPRNAATLREILEKQDGKRRGEGREGSS